MTEKSLMLVGDNRICWYFLTPQNHKELICDTMSLAAELGKACGMERQREREERESQ